ncbi:hypothetical protein [Parasediminibacterium sp. JCM 36343]|uniref:hypothetical protein n=1 Tax=Parasediminibacterium sp. JCM 36343 TaxID=3374279 RepID=UPI00397DCB75
MKSFVPSFLLLALFASSCMSGKYIAKGNLDETKTYDFSFFIYEDTQDSHLKSCKVFISQINDKAQTVLEKIVYYKCRSSVPFKIVYSRDNNGKKILDYFVAVTDNSFTIAISTEEKKLFAMVPGKKRQDDYPNYRGIKGFRVLNRNDRIYELPFLNDVEKTFKK